MTAKKRILCIEDNRETAARAEQACSVPHRRSALRTSACWLKAKLRYELAAKPSAANGKSDRSAQKAGYGIIKPHTDALTYNKWIEKGLQSEARRREREGQNPSAVPQEPSSADD
jgi:hypothetical protein